jgi:SAM-dependent methyltransferase
VNDWRQQYLQRFYDPAAGWIDGTQEFFRLCRDTIPRGSKMLEIGSGPSNGTSRFLATLGELHGVDPDPAVRGNDALATAAVLEGATLPFESDCFDSCVSNYVVEHVPDALSHLREVARVLRPGGWYLFRTPNRFHYVALVSAATPHWFHELVANRLRNLEPGAHDPYPTLYRLNSRGAVQSAADAAGLEVQQLRLVEKEPSYGMSSRVLFLAFTGYERVVNSSDRLAFLRSNIFAVLQKSRLPGSAAGDRSHD